MVVASSDKAYGEADALPYDETTPLRGRHPYDVSKSCADLISQTYASAYGLPVAVTTGSASPHESTLVQGLFDFMLTLDAPERIIGDKAYDSDALDEELDDECIEMIAPHRSSRKKANITQDGRPLRRYKRRWTVERTISWFQNFRRLCIRYEKSTMLFQGFLHLGCSIILLRQVYG